MRALSSVYTGAPITAQVHLPHRISFSLRPQKKEDQCLRYCSSSQEKSLYVFATLSHYWFSSARAGRTPKQGLQEVETNEKGELVTTDMQ